MRRIRLSNLFHSVGAAKLKDLSKNVLEQFLLSFNLDTVYQLLDFLNKLSQTNSKFLDTILENEHLQPFIGYSRLITNQLVSLYRYECCIINCYVCSIAIV